MKVGDKIVCKKTHGYGNGEYNIRENHTYTISIINYNIEGYWITVKPWLVSYKMSKYFYTDNELRRLKLEKLCINSF